jgi:hypothetical protein
MSIQKHAHKSLRSLLCNEDLYPGAKIVKYGNKFYPSIRSAANAEGVSPTCIKNHCKVYNREQIRNQIISQIRF